MLAEAPYTVPDKPYVVLRRGDTEAIVVNNAAVDDEILPSHRAGYSGIASLRYKSGENMFVPLFSGLNYEHIHDGTTQKREIIFEPRRSPMEIRRINEHTVELCQSATANWQLESWLRYELLDDSGRHGNGRNPCRPDTGIDLLLFGEKQVENFGEDNSPRRRKGESHGAQE